MYVPKSYEQLSLTLELRVVSYTIEYRFINVYKQARNLHSLTLPLPLFIITSTFYDSMNNIFVNL